MQNWVYQLVDATLRGLSDSWGIVVSFVPALIGAAIVLVIGLIVASGLSSLVEKIISSIKLDAMLHKLGLEEYFSRAGLKMNAGKFFGALIYWFFIIAFALAVSEILGFQEFSIFLHQVINYIPSLIVASLIILAALIVGNFVRSLIRSSVMGAKLGASKFLGSLAWWATVIFGIWAALIKIGVIPTELSQQIGNLLNSIIGNLVLGIAAAFALAFGLAGKDYATHLINKIREHTKDE